MVESGAKWRVGHKKEREGRGGGEGEGKREGEGSFAHSSHPHPVVVFSRSLFFVPFPLSERLEQDRPV